MGKKYRKIVILIYFLGIYHLAFSQRPQDYPKSKIDAINGYQGLFQQIFLIEEPNSLNYDVVRKVFPTSAKLYCMKERRQLSRSKYFKNLKESKDMVFKKYLVGSVHMIVIKYLGKTETFNILFNKNNQIKETIPINNDSTYIDSTDYKYYDLATEYSNLYKEFLTISYPDSIKFYSYPQKDVVAIVCNTSKQYLKQEQVDSLKEQKIIIKATKIIVNYKNKLKIFNISSFDKHNKNFNELDSIKYVNEFDYVREKNLPFLMIDYNIELSPIKYLNNIKNISNILSQMLIRLIHIPKKRNTEKKRETIIDSLHYYMYHIDEKEFDDENINNERIELKIEFTDKRKFGFNNIDHYFNNEKPVNKLSIEYFEAVYKMPFCKKIFIIKSNGGYIEINDRTRFEIFDSYFTNYNINCFFIKLIIEKK